MTDRNMSAQDLARALVPYAQQICTQCLPGGRIIGHEYHARNIQGGFHKPKPDGSGNSLRVNLQTGKWADFAAARIGGDLLNLLALSRTDGNLGQV